MQVSEHSVEMYEKVRKCQLSSDYSYSVIVETGMVSWLSLVNLEREKYSDTQNLELGDATQKYSSQVNQISNIILNIIQQQKAG